MDQARTALRSIAPDRRALAEIGRRARLELIFGCRSGRTVLAHSYAEPPLRIGRVLPDGNGVHVILASSAPGAFGGDSLESTIEVQSGARVRLTSQSAMQVHPTEAASPARLSSVYRIHEGGHLFCEWDPLIPFRDADVDQRLRIELDGGASLVWSEAFMAGREARGERWQFARLSHELRLERSGKPAYIERYRLDRHDGSPTDRWRSDNGCYFGTVLAVSESATAALAAEIHRVLSPCINIRASADWLGDDLLLSRIVAAEGVAFHHARAQVSRILHAVAEPDAAR